MTTLYHVSPIKNHSSILAHGVEPLYASGALKRSFWVDRARLNWAIRHVQARHGVGEGQVEVWVTLRKNVRNLRKTGVAGVFSTSCATRAGLVCMDVWEYTSDGNPIEL